MLVRREKCTCAQAKTRVPSEAHNPNRICAQPFCAQPPRTSIHAGRTTAHKPCAQAADVHNQGLRAQLFFVLHKIQYSIDVQEKNE